MITAMMDATSNRRVRIAAGAMAILLVTVVTLYVIGITRLIPVQIDDDSSLLDAGAVATGKPDPSHGARVVSALAVNPLSQSLLNDFLVERIRATHRPMTKGEAELLLQLGWRSETALRNVGEVYADGSNLPKLLDVFDALLRLSSRSSEPVITVIAFMETEPAYRAALVNKLAQDPPWRSMLLLLTANQLATREATIARLRTYQALARTNKPPSEIEIAAVLPPLHAQGFGKDAFNLAQDVRRRMGRAPLTRPLTDMDFSRAARRSQDQGVMTVYDWTVEHGDGFGVGFGSDAKGLMLEWDGRGVPVFARQRSSALAGAYQLAVATEAGAEGDDAIGYRLVCPEGVSELRPATISGQTRLYRTDGQVACDFPMFEIFGQPQNRPRDIRATLSKMTLSRVRF